MKFFNMCRAVALTALLSVGAMPALAQSLSTPYASNAGRAGITLDVTPSANMTIDSFDLNVGDFGQVTGGGAGQTAIISVYWRNGTAAGFTSSSSGWTLLGTTSVSVAGANAATHIPVGGLALTSGQTYGLYFDMQNYVPSTFLIRYSTDVTPVSNSDLTITSGDGKGSPAFAAETFSPRMFSGAVYYTKTQTCASEGYTGTKLEWCKNICERGYTGSTLAMWIRRWTDRYRILPYCALEQPQQQG